MAVDEGLVAWIEEAMAPLGTVTGRAMMGGRTLYCDGTVFAILADDLLWFKADGESDAAWDAAGAARFTYAFADGRTGSMNYRRAPDIAMTMPTNSGAGRRWRWQQARGRRPGRSRQARDEHLPPLRLPPGPWARRCTDRSTP